MPHGPPLGGDAHLLIALLILGILAYIGYLVVMGIVALFGG